MPADLVAEWEKGGGFEVRLRETQDNLVSVLASVASVDRSLAVEMQLSFDQLPADTQAAVFRLVSLPAMSGAALKPAPSADVERFKSTPGGRTLALHWGSRAARNIAIVRRGLETVQAKSSPQGSKAFLRWFDALSDQEFIAVAMCLTGELTKPA